MPGKHPGDGDARPCAGGTTPGGRISADAAWRPGAILAFNLHTLTAWWPPGEELARACHYRTVDAEIIGQFRGAFRRFSSVGVRQWLA